MYLKILTPGHFFQVLDTGKSTSRNFELKKVKSTSRTFELSKKVKSTSITFTGLVVTVITHFFWFLFRFLFSHYWYQFMARMCLSPILTKIGKWVCTFPEEMM